MSELGAVALSLRSARESDTRSVWTLRNDPEVRVASFSEDPISFESHEEWFKNALRNPAIRIYIAVDGGDTIGYVRFHVAGQEATISVALAKEYRHRGLGSRLIDQASATIFSCRQVERLVAEVKAGNIAMRKALLHAGYEALKPKEGVETYQRSRP